MQASPDAYFDTSATVKLYLAEDGSAQVEQFYDEVRQVFCHEIGFVETRAALAAAYRQQRVDDGQHRVLVMDFRYDWHTNFSSVPTDEPLLERAAELAEGFALRGYDAVHLACADRMRRHLPELRFVSFDRNLNRAARLLGLALPDFVPQP
jgi:predicted nucleic acid-binding protein